MHWRAGKGSESASGAGEAAAARRERKRGKTTRSQRTNKSYKVYVSGRPTIDDVERASRGEKTKAMGVVEREAPYRLTRDEREAWERAKRRGGLETRSASRDGLARTTVSVGEHASGVLRRGGDGVRVHGTRRRGGGRIAWWWTCRRCGRARTATRARGCGSWRLALGASAEDLCGDEEPLMAQMRYVAAMEGGFERTALVEVLEGDADAEPAPSESEIAAARDAVSAAADRVRELKDSGKSNADDDVKAGVRCLLDAKAKLGGDGGRRGEDVAAAANGAAEVDVEARLGTNRRSGSEIARRVTHSRFARTIYAVQVSRSSNGEGALESHREGGSRSIVARSLVHHHGLIAVRALLCYVQCIYLLYCIPRATR